MLNHSDKQSPLKPALVVGFVLLLQQSALAYSAEATDELFNNIVFFGFFGIFVIVTVLMVMAGPKGEKAKEVNMGKLLLKAVGVTILVFIVLALFALSALGQL